MASTKKVFKMFPVWQDNKEEEWLTQMAKEGWGLKKYRMLYHFEKIEPANHIYKIDFKGTKNSDLDEYKAIFNHAGWEHVTQFGGWHYFRTAAENGVVPDIYSDTESRVQKYMGLLKYLTIAYFALVAMIIMYFLNPEIALSSFTKGFFTGISGVAAVAILMVFNKVRKLRSEAGRLSQ